MALNYQIFGNRVLLKKVEEPTEEKTEGGIILPLETQEREKQNKHTAFGEVVLAGFDANLVSVGDIVIFNQPGAQRVELEGKEYFLLQDIQLIGKKM